MSPNNDQARDQLEETPLCLNCLCPNKPSAHFCAKCGAPMTSYASTAPFESLFAEGHVYRQAVEKPRRLIVVFGMWLIFGTMALVGIGLLLVDRGNVARNILIAAVLLPISLLMIWKTTRSYLTRPKIESNLGQ